MFFREKIQFFSLENCLATLENEFWVLDSFFGDMATLENEFWVLDSFFGDMATMEK